MLAERRHVIRRVVALRLARRWLQDRFSRIPDDLGVPSDDMVSCGRMTRSGLSDNESIVPRRTRTVALAFADGVRTRLPPAPRMTYREIGVCLGISGERVRTIEQQALRRLRHPSRRKFFELALHGDRIARPA